LIAAANLVYFICFALIQLEMQLHMSVDIYKCMYIYAQVRYGFFFCGSAYLETVASEKIALETLTLNGNV